MGNGYEYGFWGDINLEQAKYWYEKAANQNYVKGIHNLGVVLFLQKHGFVAQRFHNYMILEVLIIF
ncbi:hypothetical protein MY149_15835 [Acinetobacter indicus]|nr:hypothetical protein [Acinetobacter indicus]